MYLRELVLILVTDHHKQIGLNLQILILLTFTLCPIIADLLWKEYASVAVEMGDKVV